MYTFRPFRNSDPPRLAEIWREQPPLRGRFPAMTSGFFDQLILSKPYFDPAGLIVALRDGVPVGFVHAGFGGSDDEQTFSRESGAIYMLMLRDGHRGPQLADELIRRAEVYLREAGARVLYAGGVRPLNAFYLGVYGGSELPGVLTLDEPFVESCRRCGYREIDHVVVLQLGLADFRAPITRSQRLLRRELVVREDLSPAPSTWWSACTTGAFDSIRFRVETAAGGKWAGDVSFWDVEPLSTGWSAVTAGMYDLQVDAARRRQGIATFLLCAAFEKLAGRGVARVEAQTMQNNVPAIELYKRLGFEQIDEGIVFRKDAN